MNLIDKFRGLVGGTPVLDLEPRILTEGEVATRRFAEQARMLEEDASIPDEQLLAEWAAILEQRHANERLGPRENRIKRELERRHQVRSFAAHLDTVRTTNEMKAERDATKQRIATRLAAEFGDDIRELAAMDYALSKRLAECDPFRHGEREAWLFTRFGDIGLLLGQRFLGAPPSLDCRPAKSAKKKGA